MKFETKYGNMIYCKDNSYQKKYDNDDFYNYGIIWYYKGYLMHREDGPAVEQSIMSMYYLNGINYSEKEYYNIVNLKKKMDILNEV